MIEQIMNDVAERANENLKINPGDYKGEDGLWYCGRCHTNKQVLADIPGKPEKEIRAAVCRCEQEIAAVAEHNKKCNQLRKECFTYKEQHKATFANDRGYNPENPKRVAEYLENFETLKGDGKGLLLYGSFGTGKSHTAHQIANALIDRECRVKVWECDTLLNALQAEREKNAFLRTLSRYDLVVLDDFGAERKNDAARSLMYSVINALYLSKTPFIITTNLTPEEFQSPIDPEEGRCYDRIQERCKPVHFEGVNIRSLIARELHW